MWKDQGSPVDANNSPILTPTSNTIDAQETGITEQENDPTLSVSWQPPTATSSPCPSRRVSWSSSHSRQASPSPVMSKRASQSTGPSTLLYDHVVTEVQANEALYARVLSFRTIVNEIQARAPEGMKYSILQTTKDTETTLEQVLQSRGRCGNTLQTRRKINTHSEVVTHKECVEQLKKKNEDKKGGKKKKKKTKRRIQMTT